MAVLCCPHMGSCPPRKSMADHVTATYWWWQGGGGGGWAHLLQELSHPGGVAGQAGDALVDQHQVPHPLGGVLQQAHGPDVVLGDVVPAAPLPRVLEEDGRCVHQQRHHACKVLDKVPIKDLHLRKKVATCSQVARCCKWFVEASWCRCCACHEEDAGSLPGSVLYA